MKPFSSFIVYVREFYEDDDISVGEAIKYTKMYKSNFPNLWSNGDSLDREKFYELFLMGRADCIAKENKEKEEVK
jgi:acyl-coenzyme A synthetase/AMP-(fatty) acid ligase